MIPAPEAAKISFDTMNSFERKIAVFDVPPEDKHPDETIYMPEDDDSEP